ncbi:MAG: RIP metalloprotease RseP [Eubacteriales bacterium]|nr:RIP metalloprotease RseP [Eubacteriales bacterium]MDD4324060.1 RIP metalloprotease RseP [Eubacteriales bacterium]MDD4541441.1 RIP metalloprotease RseP [Eubacteriales bacterium]
MTLLGILVGILVLSLIMILHEAGHYFMGKALGFKIEEFSMFMGPVLFEREKNGVKFNIKAIPIGASVRFAGEEETEVGEIEAKYDADDPGLFFNRPKWRRAVVVFMGPFINLVTALLAFLILFNLTGAIIPKVSTVENETVVAASGEIGAGDEIISINGYRVRSGLDASMAQVTGDPAAGWDIVYLDADSGEEKGTHLSPQKIEQTAIGITYLDDNGRFVVQYVAPDSNAGNPVLEVEDEIIAIEGIPFSDHERISNVISSSVGTPLTIEIIRNEERMRVQSAPSLIISDMPLGLYLTQSYEFGDTLNQAFAYPWSIIRSNIAGIGMIFSGQLSLRDSLAGPIGIVSIVSETVQQSTTFRQVIEYVLMLFGLISVAVGFFNLLPIPPLDGGHLLFAAMEGIKRKPLSDRFKQVVTSVGLVIFLALFILVIYLDASRLLGF